MCVLLMTDCLPIHRLSDVGYPLRAGEDASMWGRQGHVRTQESDNTCQPWHATLARLQNQGDQPSWTISWRADNAWMNSNPSCFPSCVDPSTPVYSITWKHWMKTIQLVLCKQIEFVTVSTCFHSSGCISPVSCCVALPLLTHILELLIISIRTSVIPHLSTPLSHAPLPDSVH